jgi:hypothetical protein
MSKYSQYKRMWYLKNKQRILNARKKYYAKNKKSIIDQHRKYVKSNKKKVFQMQKSYRENNKDKIQAYMDRTKSHRAQRKKLYNLRNKKRNSKLGKIYRQNNRGRIILNNLKYSNAKKHRIPKWITEKELNEINEFYKNCPKGMVVDHIIPLQGKTVSGFHCLKNLQYMDPIENIRKSNKFPYYPEEFYIKLLTCKSK